MNVAVTSPIFRRWQPIKTSMLSAHHPTPFILDRPGIVAEPMRAAVVDAYNVFGCDSVNTHLADSSVSAHHLAVRLDGVET